MPQVCCGLGPRHLWCCTGKPRPVVSGVARLARCVLNHSKGSATAQLLACLQSSQAALEAGILQQPPAWCPCSSDAPQVTWVSARPHVRAPARFGGNVATHAIWEAGGYLCAQAHHPLASLPYGGSLTAIHYHTNSSPHWSHSAPWECPVVRIKLR